MRVLVTGQSGVDKAQFLKGLLNLCNKKNRKGCDPEVGLDKETLKTSHIDCIMDLEHEFQKRAEVPNYLDMNEAVFVNGKRRILSELKTKYSSFQNVVVATHLVYYRKKSFYHKMDWDAFRDFSPDLIVTLIDDVTTVSSRIRERTQSDDYVRSTTLKDVMVWRETEIMLAQTLASNLFPDRPIPFFVVAVNHKPQILYQLMFETVKKKAYASFPITAAKADPSLESQVQEFKKYLKQGLIVFDPYTIREKMLQDQLLELLGAVVPSATGTISFDKRDYRMEELLPILADITGQIITRDERLVSQSQAVIAYRPALSLGSSYELQFAEGLGKSLIAYHPKQDGTSPFGMKSGILERDFERFLARIREYAQDS
jgi:adenylate kinase